MSHRVILLWTVPRSVSTSFERMISARGDHVVFDEPFSRSYYYGPDRRSARYTETLPDSSAEQVLESIENAALSGRSSSRTWPTTQPSCSVPTCWSASTTASSCATRQRRCRPWRDAGRTSPTTRAAGSTSTRRLASPTHWASRAWCWTPTCCAATPRAWWRSGANAWACRTTRTPSPGSRGCARSGTCGATGTRPPLARPASASCASHRLRRPPTSPACTRPTSRPCPSTERLTGDGHRSE